MKGDVISQDAVYHRFNFNELYRKASRGTEGHDYADDGAWLHGIALADIVSEL